MQKLTYPVCVNSSTKGKKGGGGGSSSVSIPYLAPMSTLGINGESIHRTSESGLYGPKDGILLGTEMSKESDSSSWKNTCCVCSVVEVPSKVQAE